MIEFLWHILVWAAGIGAVAAVWYAIVHLWGAVPDGTRETGYIRLALLIGAGAVTILIGLAAATQGVKLADFSDDESEYDSR